MERILNDFIIPRGKSDIVLLMVDTIGLLASVFWITDLKEGLSIYILGLTAASLTVTLAVKIYNLFNSNDKNKEL
jgi:hypothetical protein